MARRTDNAPIGNTCPHIDEAQAIAKTASSAMSNAIDYLDDFVKQVELLRKENEELREWGNEQYNKAEDLDSELYDAKKRIETLEQDVDYLNKEIDRLENKLSNYE